MTKSVSTNHTFVDHVINLNTNNSVKQMMRSYDLDFYSTGLYDHEMFGTFDNRSTHEINRDIESLIEQRRQEEEKNEEQRKIYTKEIEERRKIAEEKERLFELEQIEIAKQKEIKRINKLKELKEQCGNYNKENDTFVDPITFEEMSIADGIILDTQVYSIASMLTWSKEQRIVPHSRRELNELEIELIGCPELRPEDDPNSYLYQGPYYSDYDSHYESDSDSYNDFNPPPRRIYGVDLDMSWHEFVAFMQNLQSFFSNNIIDSIADESFVVDTHPIVMTIRRYYQDEAGVPQNIFDIRINAYDKNLHHRSNDTGVDPSFLRRVKSLILSHGRAREFN
jgi:hypothetical protein